MHAIPMTFLLLSLSGVWVRSEDVVQAVLGETCSLPCRAQVKAGVQYLYVVWYKMQLRGDPPTLQRRGLVLRELPDGLTERFAGLKREVVLDRLTSDILLPNVTYGDGGTYKCCMHAPVGERNQEGEVVLKLQVTRRHVAESWSNQDRSDIPVGLLKIDSGMIVLLSASLILTLVISLVACKLRKLQQDQKKAWKAVEASPDTGYERLLTGFRFVSQVNGKYNTSVNTIGSSIVE